MAEIITIPEYKVHCVNSQGEIVDTLPGENQKILDFFNCLDIWRTSRIYDIEPHIKEALQLESIERNAMHGFDGLEMMLLPTSTFYLRADLDMTKLTMLLCDSNYRRVANSRIDFDDVSSRKIFFSDNVCVRIMYNSTLDEMRLKYIATGFRDDKLDVVVSFDNTGIKDIRHYHVELDSSAAVFVDHFRERGCISSMFDFYDEQSHVEIKMIVSSGRIITKSRTLKGPSEFNEYDFSSFKDSLWYKAMMAEPSLIGGESFNACMAVVIGNYNKIRTNCKRTR